MLDCRGKELTIGDLIKNTRTVPGDEGFYATIVAFDKNHCLLLLSGNGWPNGHPRITSWPKVSQTKFWIKIK